MFLNEWLRRSVADLWTMLTPPRCDVMIPGTTRGPLAVVSGPLPYLTLSGAALLMTATSSRSSSAKWRPDVLHGVYFTTLPESLPDLRELGSDIFLIILQTSSVSMFA